MVWFLVWLGCVVVAGAACERKRLSRWWIPYIILLPPIAALHALVAAPNRTALLKREGRRPCVYCAEPVLKAARVCPHCRSALT